MKIMLTCFEAEGSLQATSHSVKCMQLTTADHVHLPSWPLPASALLVAEKPDSSCSSGLAPPLLRGVMRWGASSVLLALPKLRRMPFGGRPLFPPWPLPMPPPPSSLSDLHRVLPSATSRTGPLLN